ncbi:capsid protein [Alces alces faeces associated genomovirus MP157]|uniref:Capsid protein n=1 Tax=Alces alces faeces associated genomovirus MP157 TaxID=2219113 RepID=A0A2Z5CHR0_9VIRU|nr:capsid protein [Alces alces faeces associated genomovirus MP157]AXB22629.1 capsid protein [Alces alces faeces associated genomovirus MP157]
MGYAKRRSTSSRRTTRGPYRRYTAKRRSLGKAKRPYRRTYRKKPMTKRRILNATSTKKKDNMLISTNTTAANPIGGATYTTNPAILIGAQTFDYVFPFLCTYRDFTTRTGGSHGFASDTSTRSASTVFMRGYKECITIQTSDGVPWLWRRILISLKGPLIAEISSVFNVAQENSAGFTRVVNAANPGQRANVYNLIFDGTQDADWNSPIDAKLDRNRVTVMYDKTITLASGNEDGMIRKYNRWHGFNKNFVYDDDKAGGQENGSGYHAQGKAGMGDVYVIDIFRPRTGTTTATQLSLHMQGTLYWHEK